MNVWTDEVTCGAAAAGLAGPVDEAVLEALASL